MLPGYLVYLPSNITHNLPSTTVPSNNDGFRKKVLQGVHHLAELLFSGIKLLPGDPPTYSFLVIGFHSCITILGFIVFLIISIYRELSNTQDLASLSHKFPLEKSLLCHSLTQPNTMIVRVNLTRANIPKVRVSRPPE